MFTSQFSCSGLTCSFFQYFDFSQNSDVMTILCIFLYVCMCVCEKERQTSCGLLLLTAWLILTESFSIKYLLNHICLIMLTSNLYNHQCGLSIRSPRGEEWSFQPCRTTLTFTESNLRIRGLKGLSRTMTTDTEWHSLLGAQVPRTAQVVQL